MDLTLILPALRRRARPAAPPSPRLFELLAGQLMDLAMAPGDALYVDAGCVVLQLPARWLGESLVQPSQRLRAGESWHCVERTTIMLRANETSRVQRLVA